MAEDRDQTTARLRHLCRLREIFRAHGNGSELRIGSLPEPARTEARLLAARIGELDPARRQARQERLLELAGLEAILDDIRETPQNAGRIRRLRAAIRHERSALTRLPLEPGQR